MCIVQPAQVPWRTPSADPPLVQVEVTRFGDGDVTVPFGAGPADLAAALTRLPTDARLVDALGGTDLTLLFRTASPAVGELDAAATSPEIRPAQFTVSV
jgi:uncharacterized repeat protein (TIGR03917 family)